MATEETKPVERVGFEKYAKPRFSPECFNRSKATGQYFDGGVQNEYEAFVAGRDAALERAATLAEEVAKEVGGDFSKSHQLNVGLNTFMVRLRALKGRE